MRHVTHKVLVDIVALLVEALQVSISVIFLVRVDGAVGLLPSNELRTEQRRVSIGSFGRRRWKTHLS